MKWIQIVLLVLKLIQSLPEPQQQQLRERIKIGDVIDLLTKIDWQKMAQLIQVITQIIGALQPSQKQQLAEALTAEVRAQLQAE